MVVEHFLGRAATEVLHNAALLHIAEHANHSKMLTRQRARCIPRSVFHLSVWKANSLKFAPGREWWHHARRWQRSFAEQVLGEEKGVRSRREQGRSSTVDRNVQQSLRAADRSGRPGSRLHRPCPGAPRPP